MGGLSSNFLGCSITTALETCLVKCGLQQQIESAASPSSCGNGLIADSEQGDGGASQERKLRLVNSKKKELGGYVGSRKKKVSRSDSSSSALTGAGSGRASCPISQGDGDSGRGHAVGRRPARSPNVG